VFVNPAYRGNGYCGLLLLNVMYYFDQRTSDPDHLSFSLWAHRSNRSARRAYRKIFGDESRMDYQYTVHKLIRFST
jgi:predicted GNAT family acetyltransferase